MNTLDPTDLSGPAPAARALMESRANSITQRPAPCAYPMQIPLEDAHLGGFLEYWQILSRRKAAILTVACCGAVIGAAVTLPQVPTYQARTTLEVQEVNPEQTGLARTSEAPTYNALSDIQTQIKLLQSDTLTALTASRLADGKTRQGATEPEPLTVWRRLLGLPGTGAREKREDLILATARSMKVRTAGQTRVIELVVESPDPKLAADFANARANEFIDQNVEARWKMAQHTGDWLGRQLNDMRSKLEQSEDALQAYARKAGLLYTGQEDSNGKTNLSDEKLKQLQEELSAATAARVARESRYETARTMTRESAAGVLIDPAFQGYETKLTDLNRQIAELSVTYTPDYPRVKRLQAQVQTLESAVERQRTAAVNKVKSEYDEAVRREDLVKSSYEQQAHTVTDEGEKAIQYNILRREAESNRRLYEAMLQRVKESSVTAALRASNIRVVDAATVAAGPYRPNISVNTGLGIFVGLFVGFVGVVLRERTDRHIRVPSESGSWLGAPELGVIPKATATGKKWLWPRSAKPASRALSHAALAPPESEMGDRVELITLQRPATIVAEAFRAVLPSILFGNENIEAPRVIVISSANPAEGKTTVSTNLAIALSEIGQKVLLVDGDVRRPQLHGIFAVKNDRGLSSILAGGSLIDEGLMEVIQETLVPGLFVLPSGPALPSTARLLFASQMPELLRHLRDRFDTVVIDAPPLLQAPDARLLGRMADGVILVMRAGETTREAIAAAYQRLVRDRTATLGTILNCWDPKASPAGYKVGYDVTRDQAAEFRLGNASAFRSA